MVCRFLRSQNGVMASAAAVASLALAVLLCPQSALGWGYEGHRIVAVIAADNLTTAAQSHVANILGVPADQIGVAMEAASVLPDSKFRKEDRSTAPWHFIDICLRDRRIDVPGRCRNGNCVTGKIDEYSRRLKDSNYDRWGAAGDLAFLIHFVGDIHQPLHSANDADEGGNCVKVDSQPRAKNLHYAWDTTIVRRLEHGIDSGRPETTARRLEQTYASEKALDAWIPGHTDDIAWESNQVARSDVYAALKLPVEPCDPPAALCSNEPEVPMDSEYLDHADTVAGHQLAKAGFRLASLLNEIWTQPFGPDDLKSAEISASVGSSKTVGGQIVGNRRSKIYAWLGCRSYDRMAPENRVVFASRDAAEQAGYRAARNCP
jgi:S1/P1 Nuclease/Metal binding domain of Ada